MDTAGFGEQDAWNAAFMLWRTGRADAPWLWDDELRDELEERRANMTAPG